ncbi:galactokinase [Streptomyces pinistramenti]|uniref:galactokinase n=1 Tax=Streptomyces pinistramenti TaxID=2884812 RepID=UPI001D097B68|nr:galactokinase [Streptomyces pinistramenti]MCB5907614.1 galactokinase [Streptomyces pinistramenti]
MTAHEAAAPAAEHGAAPTEAAFRAVHGAAPAGIWAAPGRVNLIGEHTDYNDGFVLPLALTHTTIAAAAPRTDGILRLHSGNVDGGIVELRTDDLRPAPRDTAARSASTWGGDGRRAEGWAAYPAGVVRAMREAGLPVGGADLHFDSTVPTGAGLSSSAALEVVTALALNDLYALGLAPQRLARLAQRAENAFVGVPCGIMDQTAAACATEGHALFLDTRDLHSRQVPFDVAAQGLRLLVVDTRVKHELGDGAYAERRAGCERGARVLGVPALRDVPYAQLTDALAMLADAPDIRALVRHVVTENRRVEEVVAHLDAGDIRAIGPLLTAGHASLRDDFAVSCAELDLAVDAALAAGAVGARMTGGGFGGSAIVLVDDVQADAVDAAVTAAFAAAGHTAPRIFTAVPGPGARRLA